MKNMAYKILVDTNILLDYLLTREPYFDDANKIVLSCTIGNIKGCIAVNSIPNMFYILRKDFNPDKRREALINLCMIFEVVGIDKTKLLACLDNKSFDDFEDCLQSECAKEFGADFIITRNVKDFKLSNIPAITPGEFLQIIN
jgi:predicted nucleic acid-binding protein